MTPQSSSATARPPGRAPARTPGATWRRVRRRVRRRVLMHRRVVGALLAGVAVWVGVSSAGGQTARLTPVVVAAHPLGAGTVLDARALTTRDYLPASVPSSAVSDARPWWGRRLATPLASGEPLTRNRLLGSEQRHAWPGLTTVPVRLGDPEAADLLRTGDRIDLLAVDPRTAGSSTLARDVPVVSLVGPASGGFGPGPPGTVGAVGGAQGRLVLLALPSPLVETVVAAGSSRLLAFTFAG